MFNRKQRTGSLLLILVLLLNFGFGGISGIAAGQETFEPEKYVIDFCDYNFSSLTAEGYAQFKKDNPSGTPTAGNMYDVNIYNGGKVGTYSLIDDSTAAGNKYLNYVKDSGGKNGGLYNYMFVANPTGNFSTELKSNTGFQILPKGMTLIFLPSLQAELQHRIMFQIGRTE